MPLHNGNFSPTCSFLPRTIGHHGRQKSGRLSGSLPGQHLQMEIKSDERLNESNSGQCHNIYVHENSDGEVYRLQWHKNDTKPSVFLCTYVLSFLSLMRSFKYFHPKRTIVSIHKICQIFDDFLRTLMGCFLLKLHQKKSFQCPEYMRLRNS